MQIISNSNIKATIKNNKVKIALLFLILAFSYWVWPTPWRYDRLGNTTARTNRFTGKVEFLSYDYGWHPNSDTKVSLPGNPWLSGTDNNTQNHLPDNHTGESNTHKSPFF